MIKKIIKDYRGISYPELLVVIFIIGMLSSVVLANTKDAGWAGEVYIAAQKVMSDVRFAQNYSLSAKEFGVSNEVPEGGWGIYLKKNQAYYSIYADLGEMSGTANGDHLCLDDCSDISAEQFRRIKVPTGITIDKIEVTSSGGTVFPVDEIHITFEPPDPLVHICLGIDDCAYSQVEIFLINKYLDKRKVVVNFLGMVDNLEAFY